MEGLAIAIVKMAAGRMSATEIAVILEVDMQLVQQALATANGK